MAPERLARVCDRIRCAVVVEVPLVKHPIECPDFGMIPHRPIVIPEKI